MTHELKGFLKKEKISMHIPGHKGGRGLGSSFGKITPRLDLTELDGTDNLQNPSGILKASQEYCAKIFGAEETHFLTGGSSLGLRASILGTVPRGGAILVDRTCHKAVISAITLGGLEPVFIYPEYDRDSGLYLGLSPSTVERAINEHPDIFGAIITSPTYYGICSDISKISKLLHRHNKFLIVDEAHGAHFAFNKKLSTMSALTLGADLCIESAHKTLPALGQCSLLHIGKGAITDKARLLRTLRMIQTTSPSYMLMASLDGAVHYMQRRGRAGLNSLIREISELKSDVLKKTHLRFADEDTLGVPQDMSRIVLDFSPIGISGHFAERLLIDEFGIYPEMSDNRYVVLIPSVMNTKAELKRLLGALVEIGGRIYNKDSSLNNSPLPEVELIIQPADAIAKPFESVSPADAVGRVCASVISACPPGAVVLVPGQLITSEAIDYCRSIGITDKIDVIV